MFKQWISKLTRRNDKDQPSQAVCETPSEAKKSPTAKASSSHGQTDETHEHVVEPDITAQSMRERIPQLPDKTRFVDLSIELSLLKAIHSMGFEYCTPIQAEILPLALSGRDAIGKAQTGTGKTAAFLISVIDDLLKNPLQGERYFGEPRALIIAPVRELAVQIANEAKALCRFTSFRVDTLIGGVNMERQRESVKSHALDIVVATPGRLLDLMQQRLVSLGQLEALVLDEADRLMDMGFTPQVKRIVGAAPDYRYRQTQLFSATFSPSILQLAERWTYDAVRVDIEPETLAQSNVDQKVYLVTSKEKWPTLLNILRKTSTKKTMIFANRKDQTLRLFTRLEKAGFKVGLLTGDVPQAKRNRTLEKFKQDNISILVATDVAGRGIHIDEVSHVINYNLPEDPEDYVHRIGRTGRAGALGVSISLACEDEAFQLPAIEQLLGEKLVCTLPPEE